MANLPSITPFSLTLGDILKCILETLDSYDLIYRYS